MGGIGEGTSPRVMGLGLCKLKTLFDHKGRRRRILLPLPEVEDMSHDTFSNRCSEVGARPSGANLQETACPASLGNEKQTLRCFGHAHVQVVATAHAIISARCLEDASREVANCLILGAPMLLGA